VEAGKKVRSKTKLKSRFNCYGGFGFFTNHFFILPYLNHTYDELGLPDKDDKAPPILTDENRQ
jgi:hypothetical protein